MKSEIISIKDPSVIKKVVKALKQGKTLAYPSESCYGIGCLVSNKKAVQRIYTIKKRALHKPLIVLASSLARLKNYAVLSKLTVFLTRKAMPGNLTLIVPRKSALLKAINAHEISFRIPGNVFLQKLCKQTGLLTSTSLNIEGSPSLFSFKNVLKQFNGKIDVFIDAGTLPRKKQSTLFDVQTQSILRTGIYSKKKIEHLLSQWRKLK